MISRCLMREYRNKRAGHTARFYCAWNPVRLVPTVVYCDVSCAPCVQDLTPLRSSRQSKTAPLGYSHHRQHRFQCIQIGDTGRLHCCYLRLQAGQFLVNEPDALQLRFGVV